MPPPNYARDLSSPFHDGSQLHKAIISLNNLAVSLLNRGFFEEALGTLKDTILLMRYLAEVDEDGSDTLSDVEIQRTLHQIRKCTAPCFNSSTTTTSTTLCHFKSQRPALHVISSQDSPVHVYNMLTARSFDPTSHLAFPIRIDPIDYESCYSSDDVALESAMILYNYSVAHACLLASDVGMDDGVKMTVHAKVYRLLLMARSLLSSVDGQMDFDSRHLLVKTVVTHGLVDASVALNLSDEFDVCLDDMRILLHEIQLYHMMYPAGDLVIAAAA